MSAFTRLGPQLARSALLHQSKHQMATASAAIDPIQKLFADKIREFRTTNKGLDDAHKKLLVEEMTRLKRVFKVEDESKLSQIDTKFAHEVDVSLRDVDETKEIRHKIASGQYLSELVPQETKPDALLASIPEQVTHDMHLPPMNKPNPQLFLEMCNLPEKPKIGEIIPDYKYAGPKMTPEKLQEDLRVQFGSDMPTIDDDKSPQRDVVNFPRIHQKDYTPPTRFHFIPESWFQFFHPKTGVSGPFIFAGSFTTFLLSKEWLVWEHELLAGCTSTAIFTIGVIKYGPKLSAWLRNDVKVYLDSWENWRMGHIELMDTLKTHYKSELGKAETIKELYNIRQHDVENQLELEYRNRVKTVHEDVKRRLNYLVSKATSERQILHKNMVNWVLTNAVQAFGPKQESEVLDNCIENLKVLANKNVNVV